MDAVNPAIGRPWARVAVSQFDEVDRAVEAAEHAFRSSTWARLPSTERGRLLLRLADLVDAHADQLAEVETLDNGKLLAETRAQVGYIPTTLRYFAGLTDKIEGRTVPVDKPDMVAFTRREPLGVVAAIIPWNSPLQLLSWKLAPLLAAGNTVVVKPSEHASASTLSFLRLFDQAGFPPGVVNSVTGDAAIGRQLISNPRIAKVAFTGGEAGGKEVYGAVAQGLKRVTLELGGKSANIVFADAELDAAANGVVAGIFAASGQTCVAGSRLLVQRSIHDSFVDRLLALSQEARVGDPLQPSTHIGPITTEAQHTRVLDLIRAGEAEGARCVLGGSACAPPGLEEGWFVPPTILVDAHNRMRVAREEIFGPVLTVIPFDDEDEAYAVANDSPYGLAAGAWTTNLTRALRATERLEAGMVWINTYRTVSCTMPFGGYKRSGIGRENGQEAIDAYLQTKSVWLNFSEKSRNPFVIG